MKVRSVSDGLRALNGARMGHVVTCGSCGRWCCLVVDDETRRRDNARLVARHVGAGDRVASMTVDEIRRHAGDNEPCGCARRAKP